MDEGNMTGQTNRINSVESMNWKTILSIYFSRGYSLGSINRGWKVMRFVILRESITSKKEK